MNKDKNGEWAEASPQQTPHDWTEQREPSSEEADTAHVQSSRKKSVAVPILITLICILVVVVAVGAFVLFLHKDKDDSMDAAALSASTSSHQSAPLTTVKVKAGQTTVTNTATKVQSAPAKSTADTCTELKKVYEQEHQITLKNKGDDDVKPWDSYMVYCDGKWGQIVNAEWGAGDVNYYDGHQWITIEGRNVDNGTGPGVFCFDKSNLMAYNPPQQALSGMNVVFCEDVATQQGDSSSSGSGTDSGTTNLVSTVSRASSSGMYDSPACDGRYILIVESVIVTSGENPDSKVSQRLANYPGASAATPGACGSLRAVDPDSGGDIYPIYYDYGFDLNSACVGRQNNGNVGNVRKLSNQTEKANLCG